MKVSRPLLVVLFLLFVITWIVEVYTYPSDPMWRPRTIVDVNYKTAKDALGFMKDWAVWMAGLQTATLAALGAVAKDGKFSKSQQTWATVSAVFNGFALLFTAWTLCSIPSLLVRMHDTCASVLVKGQCDFYELRFMGQWYAPRFSYFSTWQHWLWAAGLATFAYFVVVSIANSSGPTVSSQRRHRWNLRKKSYRNQL